MDVFARNLGFGSRALECAASPRGLKETQILYADTAEHSYSSLGAFDAGLPIRAQWSDAKQILLSNERRIQRLDPSGGEVVDYFKAAC
jgi:hypothetical protein